MNYANFNKKTFSFKKLSRRYIKRFDKSEIQDSLPNNHNIFNIHNNINNIKSYNKKNYGRNIKELLLNYKNIQQENTKYLSRIRNSNSTNNYKFLSVKYIRNINPILSSRNGTQEENEKSKNTNNNNNNDSIPTILKIQKLIENLKEKKSNSKECFINDNSNNGNYIFPELIKKSRPSIKNIKKSKEAEMNNINIMFSIKDKIKRDNNNKIKLNNIQQKENIRNNINDENNIEDIKNNKISQICFKMKRKMNIKKLRKQKITIDKVKNIIKENLIIDNNGNNEKIVNIRLKINSNKKSNINNETIIIKTKKESAKFLLSNFNNYKFDFLVLKKNFQKLEKNINKNDILFNKNKTMFRNPLNEKKYNEEDKNKSEKKSSKYYLPSFGFGLLSKNNE